MAQPKAFYSYMENEDKLNKLSDAQAGRLYKALYAYCRTGEKPDFSDDPLLDYAFADFLIDIERDRERYDKTCARRAEAGRKSGEVRRTKAESDEQKGTNTNKMNETEAEAEAEAEYIKKEITKEKMPERDFDRVALWVIERFNAICTDLPKVSGLTDKRRRLLFTDGMMDKLPDLYNDLFHRVQKSDQLCGRGDLKWRADFDWIIKNSVKIMEGSYDNVVAKNKLPNKMGSMFSAEGASFDLEKYAKSSMFDD